MTPDTVDQWTQDRLAARRREADRRRLIRAARAPGRPWQARAGMWLVSAGLALLARAPREWRASVDAPVSARL